MNRTVDWFGLAAVVVVLGALAFDVRRAPAGLLGVAVKLVCGLLMLGILGVVLWNTLIAIRRP